MKQPKSTAEAAELAPTQVLPEPPLDPRFQTQKLAPPEPRTRPKTNKQQRAATVVLDESAYDPSLRFLLVAAILFVLFLVLLILSKVIN